ncbi:DUF6166 domain-containing protein [Pseudomonas aeruginosa]|uniref:DUF6166 domain-containing protein n=1 Tax=Pseudomonas aeruginosa TaxID=287 RepID=UPI0032B5CD92
MPQSQTALEDLDFSKVNMPRETDQKILLRFLEGAFVALYRYNDDSDAEILPTRQDLYQYGGGYAWGYNGSGPANLSHAIAAKVFEFDNLEKPELQARAYAILDQLVSKLAEEKEHDLSFSLIRAV